MIRTSSKKLGWKCELDFKTWSMKLNCRYFDSASVETV
ncbi:hypothetical protein JCM19240_2345 [Vibrio maritimus]|uniref:Uncharacterized protein n=1 Tax=Vibrio maritimus TaxID=990268 RepID=A0A090T4G7_9VIBR|nr:hypothetical protein JCM19240_2345 [Vibrio maritimus]